MKKSTKKKIAIGAGVAAVAAGAYFLTSTKKGKKVSKKITTWIGKAEKEVLAEVKKLEVPTKKAYEKIVSEIEKKYKSLKDIDAKDVARFSQKMKGQWGKLEKSVKGKVKKAIKKPTRKK